MNRPILTGAAFAVALLVTAAGCSGTNAGGDPATVATSDPNAELRGKIRDLEARLPVEKKNAAERIRRLNWEPTEYDYRIANNEVDNIERELAVLREVLDDRLAAAPAARTAPVPAGGDAALRGRMEELAGEMRALEAEQRGIEAALARETNANARQGLHAQRGACTARQKEVADERYRIQLQLSHPR
jgi:hypothetical protein